MQDLEMKDSWTRCTLQEDRSTNSVESGQALTQINLGEVIVIVEISAPKIYIYVY